MKKYWRIGAILIGAILGYAYYHFIGCRSGVCPLTSNPWISTGYGALVGAVFAIGNKKAKKNDNGESN